AGAASWSNRDAGRAVRVVLAGPAGVRDHEQFAGPGARLAATRRCRTCQEHPATGGRRCEAARDGLAALAVPLGLHRVDGVGSMVAAPWSAEPWSSLTDRCGASTTGLDHASK